MDPDIWGPLVWGMCYDVAWAARHMDDTQLLAVKLIFESLQFLLPCRFCRESYTSFYAQMPPLSHGHQNKKYAAIKWIHDVKSKVNKKLDRPDLYFSKLVKRLETYTSISSQTQALDFLLIVAANYDAESDNPASCIRKKAWFFTLCHSLRVVLPAMPVESYGRLAQFMQTDVLEKTDVLTTSAVFQYLSRAKNAIGSSRSSGAACKHQYAHASGSWMPTDV